MYLCAGVINASLTAFFIVEGKLVGSTQKQLRILIIPHYIIWNEKKTREREREREREGGRRRGKEKTGR